MSNTDFALTTDAADFDDLPRTLRRERDAREREKRERERERESREQKATERSEREARKATQPAFEPGPSLYVPRDSDLKSGSDDDGEYPAATVKRFDVPFMHMMGFYLKAVVAAIPALILLVGISWGMGQLIKIFFPWLLKAQIYIHFPN
jgi:hypothetical protein